MNICIYASANDEIRPVFMQETERFGETVAKQGHTLVFGAGAHGLMGAAARGAKKGGGKIIGVVPTFFQGDGILFSDCTELIRTKTMRERKQILEDHADVFLILPGGVGTLDEFFEIFTLKQLSQHKKPLLMWNLDGYYTGLLNFLEYMVQEGFLQRKSLSLFRVFSTANEVFGYLARGGEETYDKDAFKPI